MRTTNRPITLVKIVEMSNDTVISVATDCATCMRAGYVLYRALVTKCFIIYTTIHKFRKRARYSYMCYLKLLWNVMYWSHACNQQQQCCQTLGFCPTIKIFEHKNCLISMQMKHIQPSTPQWRIQGGGCSGCSSTPLSLRGMQGISANIPKFTSIDIVTSILLDKNALLSFKIAS